MSEDDKITWRGYPVRWCGICSIWIISCHKCNNTSCDGGDCVSCEQDFEDFIKLSSRLNHYFSRKISTDKSNNRYQLQVIAKP